MKMGSSALKFGAGMSRGLSATVTDKEACFNALKSITLRGAQLSWEVLHGHKRVDNCMKP